MTYTLRHGESPSGAAFGSVLGLMAFFYFFARLTLFCAAWIATAEYKDDPRMPEKRNASLRLAAEWHARRRHSAYCCVDPGRVCKAYRRYNQARPSASSHCFSI
ncbi:hypothetical protein [Salmonella enterica]|uniref:hypothetical protein n=1 Tax=Salmonella enterica TaxID=28901 RepID=UPI0012601979|nr:hypothetical protein [Salmonella enterica]